MGLLVRLYNDKPSKLGIWYPHEYQATKAYEQLLGNCRNETLLVSFEIVRGLMEVTLRSAFTGTSTVYKEIEFKKDQVLKLVKFFKPGMDMQFVHIFTRGNVPLIAKPFHTSEFLKINGIRMVGEFDRGDVFENP